jgi:SAM-dependent methyltransferase
MDTPYLVSQFGNPRGVVGHLIGIAMDLKNRERNDWMVERLAPRANERILEVGCGSGYALRRIAAITGAAQVAGIDRSALMVRRAARKLREVIGTGRAEIVQGSSESLPWPDGTFDAVCLSNVTLFWDEPERHYAEIRRVLRAGGRVVVTYQPPRRQEVSRVRARGDMIQAEMREAGFESVGTAMRLLRVAPCALVTAVTPSSSSRAG